MINQESPGQLNKWVLYRQDVEIIPDNEQQVTEQINRMMVQMARTVGEQQGRVMRATHAKGFGYLKATLRVLTRLPDELRQGMFAEPKAYEVLIRLSPGPSAPISDKATGQRGLSLKVLNVAGAHLAESKETTTQDWVLALDSTFVNADAAHFLSSFKRVASHTPSLPEGVVVAGSRLARGVEAALETVGLSSDQLRFFGRTPRHPLSDAYYSQVPVRYGDYIAKVAVFPTAETLRSIGDPLVDNDADDEAFSKATSAFCSQQQAEFEFKVQLCTNLQTMPIEDATVAWPESESPYMTVARLTIPIQHAHSPERAYYFQERLSFNPAHSLEAHRPLGSIMRARMTAYLATQQFRQTANHVVAAEPQTHAEVPD